MLRFAVQFTARQSLPIFHQQPKVILPAIFNRKIGLTKGTKDPTETLTMYEVKQEIIKRLGLDRGYQLIPKSREHLLQYEPKLEDLPLRSMQDSFTSAIIPLSTDLMLQDKYVAFLGHLRFGRLMEDMDLFAVWICHKHVNVPTLPPDVHLPYTFVTILVDKITFSPEITTKATEDIRLSGHVSWVGRSSLEVVVWLEQKDHGAWQKITRALFLMAARNATNTGAAAVNPIKPATDEEKKILDGGEQRKKRRQMSQAQSIFKVEPSSFEQSLMYQLYKRTSVPSTMELNKHLLPNNCRWMSESFIMNTTASYPENRNAHNTVFGGYLMRKALEISWLSAGLYAKCRATLEHVSDISFEKPVPVSSVVKMIAYVVYTQVNYIQIMTVIEVVDESAQDDQVTTNVFYLTYRCADKVPEVLPRSYHEKMWYLHGRRKFQFAMEQEV